MNANIERTARLHGYNKWRSWEPSCEQLFDDRWDESEVERMGGTIRTRLKDSKIVGLNRVRTLTHGNRCAVDVL
jgi:hypothetical protein